MIWSRVSKDEMEGYSIPPVFQYYREVIGKDNIRLAVVDRNDPLEFVERGDVVLLRTVDERLIEAIKSRGASTTAESYELYQRVWDKKILAKFLAEYNILVPRQYELHEVESGKTYFVKPRYGSESFGITPSCICNSKEEVVAQVQRIKDELNEECVIEEFIVGVDCTTACYRDSDDMVMTHSIMVECDEIGGIQTHDGKFAYNEYCSALKGTMSEYADLVSYKVFRLLNIRHHARIDYRLSKDGRMYLIDVNLMPGLGPSAHFSKCLLLTRNLSYADSINRIIESASR